MIRTLVVAGLVVPLAACGSGVNVEVKESGDTLVLIGDRDSDDGLGIGGGGEVQLVGKCLGLGQHDSQWLVLWPPGTVIVSDDPLTINVPGFGAVGMGDYVGGGLSEVYVEQREASDIPAACPSKNLFYWFPDHDPTDPQGPTLSTS